MGKKKPFIDKTNAGHFHVVHRSQRDPLAADPDAPQRVLVPGELGQRRGASEGASQLSSRAWLEEQDLAGFEEPEGEAATSSKDDFTDLGFGKDGYNYGQHLRTIKADGIFIPAVDHHGEHLPGVPGGARKGPASVASAALSSASRMSRLSKASIMLRGVAENAFESEAELPVAVGGASNDTAVMEEANEQAKAQLDEDVLAALFDDGDDDEGEGEDLELNDDFVLQADRPSELLPVPERVRRRKKSSAVDDTADDADEDDNDSVDAESDEVEEVGDRGNSGGGAGGGELSKRRNPFYDLFPEDEDEEEVEEKEPVHGKSKGKGKSLARFASRGAVDDNDDGASTTMGEERTERFLDERFSKLLAAEYSDEEIGELDPDDPRVNGQEELEDFDDVLDEFLDSQKKRFVHVTEIMDTGSSRYWARAPKEQLRSATGSASAEAELNAAVPKTDKAGNGGLEEDYDDASSDGSIEDHPFFDGLKEKSKEEQWDAETILTTYTTTENHPTTVRIARKPKAPTIRIDKRTGLPVGTLLPAEEDRLRQATGDNDLDVEVDGDVYAGGPGENMGTARPKDEAADEKRQRKAVAKAAKAERRQEKKGTKEAFKAEKKEMVNLRQRTSTVPSTSLSAWGSGGGLPL